MCGLLRRCIVSKVMRKSMDVRAVQASYSKKPEQQSSTLQNLVNRAQDFTRTSRVGFFSNSEAEELSGLIDRIPLEELGFPSSAVQDPSSVLLPPDGRTRNGLPLVQYQHIFEDDKLSIGIFIFPSADIEIPLHDHPGMTVLSKLLYGSLKVKSFDWLPSSQTPASSSGLIKSQLTRDEIVTAPTKPMILFPTEGGNIHEFRSVTPCAVLDILAPPYSGYDGRTCTYYAQRTPSRIEDKLQVAELEAIEEPSDFGVSRKPYLGVQVD